MSNEKKERKEEYFKRLTGYLGQYEKIILADANNVGSNHLQRLRVSIRGLGGQLLMGKNTMVRKVIRGYITKLGHTEYEDLLPQVKGNVGFIFLNGDENAIKNLLEENRISAAAKAGTYAPNDVVIPAGLTGLEPTMTGFLQALAIQSKITKGQIELTHQVNLITKGQKVGPSEATLLGKLNIKPFRYGLLPTGLFSAGAWTSAEFLNITPEQVTALFQKNITRVTALSLGLEFPTLLSVPHSLIKAFKNVLALGLEGEFKFKQLDDLQNRTPAPSATPIEAPAPTQVEEPTAAPTKSESDEEMMDLFG